MEIAEPQQERQIGLKIREILNSKWIIFVLAVFVAIFWALDFPYVSLPILLAYEGLVLYFCREDIKAFLFPVIAISYSITTIHAGIGNWIFYLSIFGAFIGFLIAYIVREKVKYKRKFKRGELFPAFIIAGVGNVLGGIIGFFDIKIFLIVAFFCVLVYFLYWLFINFLSKDDKEYIAYAFIALTTLICFEIIIFYIRADNLQDAIKWKTVRIGTGEINAAAIFMISGVLSCFYLARGKKYDYLYMLLGFVFDLFVYLTYSRIALAICAIATIIYFFVDLKDSSNKKIIGITIGVIIGIVAILAIVFREKIKDLLFYYLEVGLGKNGREYLWKWCWYQFEDNIFFGIGFVTRDAEAMQNMIPGIENFGNGVGLVNAHNTMLHFLTCTGLVGTALNLYFYYKKYQMVFTKFDRFKFFVLMNYLCIFVSGCFDPTPNNSIFHIVVSLLLMALVELENEDKEPWELERKKVNSIVNRYLQIPKSNSKNLQTSGVETETGVKVEPTTSKTKNDGESVTQSRPASLKENENLKVNNHAKQKRTEEAGEESSKKQTSSAKLKEYYKTKKGK